MAPKRKYNRSPSNSAARKKAKMHAGVDPHSLSPRTLQAVKSAPELSGLLCRPGPISFNMNNPENPYGILGRQGDSSPSHLPSATASPHTPNTIVNSAVAKTLADRLAAIMAKNHEIAKQKVAYGSPSPSSTPVVSRSDGEPPQSPGVPMSPCSTPTSLQMTLTTLSNALRAGLKPTVHITSAGAAGTAQIQQLLSTISRSSLSTTPQTPQTPGSPVASSPSTIPNLMQNLSYYATPTSSSPSASPVISSRAVSDVSTQSHTSSAGCQTETDRVQVGTDNSALPNIDFGDLDLDIDDLDINVDDLDLEFSL